MGSSGRRIEPTLGIQIVVKCRKWDTIREHSLKLSFDLLKNHFKVYLMSIQIELRAVVSPELADALEAYFGTQEITQWGLMQTAPGAPFELFGFFADEAMASIELDRLRADFPHLPTFFEQTTLHDDDWQNAYKAFVQAWNDRQLHWIPLWQRGDFSSPADAAVVYLDAGMAFGTGAHETTRLCAGRLQDYRDAHASHLDSLDVIDAGCGSGILALSAAVLGFHKISAFDFDPEAIQVCSNNVAENPHIRAPEFAVANLEQGLTDHSADLLLANIQSDVLMADCIPIIRALKLGGTLALSGILIQELDCVRAHYEAAFAELRPNESIVVDSRQAGEWGDLQFILV